MPPKSKSVPNPATLLKHDFEKLVSNRSKVPPGYVFVPKGDKYVTRHCRGFTAQSGSIVYVVYDEQSHERLGLHCPYEVFKTVTANAIASAPDREKVVLSKDRKDIATARATLLRLFPRIPQSIANDVLKHGFEKGSGRVGRTSMLGDDRKVTLAVIAHARHTRTKYDSILRELDKDGIRRDSSREQAREAIKQELDVVITSWRPMAKKQLQSSGGPVTQVLKIKSASATRPGRRKPIPAAKSRPRLAADRLHIKVLRRAVAPELRRIMRTKS